MSGIVCGSGNTRTLLMELAVLVLIVRANNSSQYSERASKEKET